MKRTKSMYIRETAESRELLLYAINDGEIYRRHVTPIIENLSKKYKKGIFDAQKAIDAFFPVATAAAKKYCREFARLEDAPHIFNVTDRFTVAAGMADYYAEEISG